ncbi:hypothetical protein [Streptomyces sp. NPDC093225]|uniref:hypothetical protein n=1 Tax=Streptomyces sp. NPDC093225 TaxID=3366034 RepID=UPI003824C26B
MSSSTFASNQDLTDFLQRWYGAPRLKEVELSVSPAIPRALVWWHEISARWGGVITSHNYAIPLAELHIEDGVVPFWVENQGTWIWAFDPNDSNFAVYEREPSAETSAWEPTGEGLHDFLHHATILEAVLGAPVTKVAHGVELTDLWPEGEVQELPFPAWKWPGPDSRILSGGEWLALVHSTDSAQGGYDVTLAANSLDDVSWADEISGISWRTYASVQDQAEDLSLPW